MPTALIVDDEAIVRAGILHMLSTAKITAYPAENGEIAVKLARDLKPDIILLDLKLTGLSALEIAKKFFHLNRRQKILILTGYKDLIIAKRLLAMGVLGYLIKGCHENEIMNAVRIVLAGGAYICHQIMSKITSKSIDDDSPFYDLTDKELEIALMMIQRFMDAKRIAKSLFLSLKTVHTYRRNVFKKLKVDNEVGVLLAAIKYGLLNFDQEDGLYNILREINPIEDAQ